MSKKLIDMQGTLVCDMGIENRITVWMSEELHRIEALPDEQRIATIGDLETLSDAGKVYFKNFGKTLVEQELSQKCYYAEMYMERLRTMVPKTIDTNFKEYLKYLRKLWRRRNPTFVEGVIVTTEISDTPVQSMQEAATAMA